MGLISKYGYLVPGLVSTLFLIVIYFNVIYSYFCNYSEFHLSFFPSISRFSGVFPQRVFFCIGLNFISFGLIPSIFLRLYVFLFIRRLSLCFSVLFVFSSVFLVSSVCLLSATSLFDNSTAHNIFAACTFLSLLVFFLFWSFQDVLDFIKNKKCSFVCLFVFRACLLFTLIILCVLTLISFGLQIVSLPWYPFSVSKTVFAAFEFTYVFVSLAFSASLSIDHYFMQKEKDAFHQRLLSASVNGMDNSGTAYTEK